MKRVIVEKLSVKPLEQQSIEIVERKGRGHPDFLIDASAESVSRALCKYYLENFGIVLHHNLDKGLLVGGRSNPSFGGGSVEEPIHIIVAGRAVTTAKKGGGLIKVPIGEIVPASVKSLLSNIFRFLDPERHVETDYKIREGSADLVALFGQSKKVPLANDTSFGVSFAPLTTTERLALETERLLNSEKVKRELPEVGEDIKVMALRIRNKLRLTIAAAMVSGLIPDRSHYLSVKEQVAERVKDLAAKFTEREVDVLVNAADKPKSGIFYLTVTGTSAERGDDGNIGRGNRINGLITPCRQMSLEATAGKNPINHVGKTYNVLAKIIAEKIVREVRGVKENYVKILSQIGKPISEPQVAHVQLVLEKGYSLSNVSADVKSIVEEEVANVSKIGDLIIKGEVALF